MKTKSFQKFIMDNMLPFKPSKARQLFVRTYKGRQYTSYNRAMLNDLILSLKRENK